MIVCRTITYFRAERCRLNGTLGFVPTMGFLHQGHISLIKASLEQNDHTAVSIFVNPTQFNSEGDLTAYPHDEPGDLEKLEQAGVSLVFVPSREEVYPEDFQTYVMVEIIAQGLEGSSRPGHFRGVATVVTKLFNIVQPDRAYFGQKDAQQVAVIKQLVHDLNFPVEIVVCPTMREADGLAMSSRNILLDTKQRQSVTVLHKALKEGAKAFESGVRDPELLIKLISDMIKTQPDVKIEYIRIVNANTMKEFDFSLPLHTPVLASLAVFIGKTRLIDNVLLNE